MKHTILGLLFFTLVTSVSMGQAYEHCDTRTLKDTCKDYINPPYRYDASNTILITFQRKPQLKEIELPMFLGEKYKLIFNTYALPPGVEIHIYNKDANHEKRKELFSCSSSDAKRVFIYETEHFERRIYVDYVIPAKHGVANGDDALQVQGCGVLVIGYK